MSNHITLHCTTLLLITIAHHTSSSDTKLHFTSDLTIAHHITLFRIISPPSHYSRSHHYTHQLFSLQVTSSYFISSHLNANLSCLVSYRIASCLFASCHSSSCSFTSCRVVSWHYSTSINCIEEVVGCWLPMVKCFLESNKDLQEDQTWDNCSLPASSHFGNSRLNVLTCSQLGLGLSHWDL